MAGPVPTRGELEAARSRQVEDVLAPALRVVFCGINPGLYTAWAGHHFARPGNRFWPALHRSGFTPRLFAPSEQRRLLALGLGVTNLVPRTTARAPTRSMKSTRRRDFCGKRNASSALRSLASVSSRIVGRPARSEAWRTNSVD